MPSIYLGNKTGYIQRLTNNVRVTFVITTSTLEICSNIQKVSYAIKYDEGFEKLGRSSYTFYIYSGTQSSKKMESNIHCIRRENCFRKVEAYYSQLDPSTPFFMSFNIDQTAYYQTFKKIRTITQYNKLLNMGLDGVDLKAKEEYSSFCLNNLFYFSVGNENNSHIKQISSVDKQPKTKGDNKKFKTITYLVDSSYKGGRFLFYSKYVFELQPKVTEIKNEIENSLFKDIEANYNCLLVHYVNSAETELKTFQPSLDREEKKLDTKNDIPNNTALFVELIKCCDNRIQYVRTGREPKHWKKLENPLSFKDESTLFVKLEEIKSSLYDIVTYDIDLKPAKSINYNNNSVNISLLNKNSYVAYTHIPINGYKNKKTQVMFKSHKFEVISSSDSIFDGPFENIIVYYRTQKPIDIDRNPILLLGLKEKNDERNGKQHYYIRSSKDNNQWECVTSKTLTKFKICDQAEVKDQDISTFLNKDNVLLSLLRHSEFNLFDKIVVLLNKKATYGKDDLGRDVSENPKLTLSEKQPQNIVVNKTSFRGNYFQIKHTITISNVDNTNIAIIPYIFNMRIDILSNQKTPSLLFYGGSGEKCASTESSGSVNPGEFYVFFYNEVNLPLLLCYCNTLYGPISKREYHKWMEVGTITTLSDSNVLTQLDIIKDKMNLIDISATDKKYNFHDKLTISISELIKVEFKSQTYDRCNLFGYYSHRYMEPLGHKPSQFIITTNGNDKTIIVLLDDGQTFTHIYVYYSLISKLFLVVEISQNESVNYYKYNDFTAQKSNKVFLKNIQKINIGTNNDTLTDHLINEHYNSNKTVTYRLDKITQRNDFVGTSYNNNTINLTTFTDASDKGYNIYTHVPSGEHKSSNVLYNDKSIKIDNSNVNGNKLVNIDNHKFSKIKTYSLTDKDNFHLLIELTEDTQTYYFYRVDKNATSWKQITQGIGPLSDDMNTVLSDQAKITLFLKYLKYAFTKSVIIYLDDKNYRYNMKLIDNSCEDISNLTEFKTQKIINDHLSRQKNYRYYKHRFFNIYSSFDSKDVTGFRLLKENKEIKLYNDSNMKNRAYLFYEYKKNDVYVYFNKQNNDPIGVCYEGKAYSPIINKNNNCEWFWLKNINNCYNFDQVEPELDKITQITSSNQVRSNQNSGIHGNGISVNGHQTSPQIGDGKQGTSSQQSTDSTTTKAVGGAVGGILGIAAISGGGFLLLKKLGIIGVAAVAAAL